MLHFTKKRNPGVGELHRSRPDEQQLQAINALHCAKHAIWAFARVEMTDESGQPGLGREAESPAHLGFVPRTEVGKVHAIWKETNLVGRQVEDIQAEPAIRTRDGNRASDIAEVLRHMVNVHLIQHAVAVSDKYRKIVLPAKPSDRSTAGIQEMPI
jgi:hypothetical protein